MRSSHAQRRPTATVFSVSAPAQALQGRDDEGSEVFAALFLRRAPQAQRLDGVSRSARSQTAGAAHCALPLRSAEPVSGGARATFPHLPDTDVSLRAAS